MLGDKGRKVTFKQNKNEKGKKKSREDTAKHSGYVLNKKKDLEDDRRILACTSFIVSKKCVFT